jgi:2-oxoacid:acceptor oxidoreductase gamma subunit (pyruvate/2-ketoisovalerate family)
VNERELLFTGIGGQGVQLAAQVIARAAIAEGKEVQLFGSYGGMMRGGDTLATVVVSDTPVEAPPTIASTWSAILMHHDYVEQTIARLRAGTIVLRNSTVYEGDVGVAGIDLHDLPATELAATTVGNVMTASMVMAGAYARLTGLVALDSLKAAVEESLPPYRTKHIELNMLALDTGWEAA